MTRSPKLLQVAHHHGFKCAGCTVIHLLNRNWPERVLHVERRIADARFHCADVVPYLAGGAYTALTSHLLTMPRPGEEIAEVHFALVRDPIARLLSAFHFVPADRRGAGFAEFIERHAFQANDFQVRHLAAQRDGGGLANDWRVDLDAVPVGGPHVLIGLVERFEDSMFLLERRLAARGVAFDGSVGTRHNAGGGGRVELDDDARQQARACNVADYELYGRVVTALDRELAAVDPDGSGRAEFGSRCARRAGVEEPYLGVGPVGWTYLDDGHAEVGAAVTPR